MHKCPEAILLSLEASAAICIAGNAQGSIHEGGELGYSLSHGFGAAFDNPDLIVTVAVGVGESETGPLATSWHSNKFLDPVRDGAVLPILHLNGYKIANPTILARIPPEELDMLMRGLGWTPHVVAGDDPDKMHAKMAEVMEGCVLDIRAIQEKARKAPKGQPIERPKWPMIILRTPKGWTGPKEVDGHKVEGFWRAHQIPILDPERPTPAHLAEVRRMAAQLSVQSESVRRVREVDRGVAGNGAERYAAHYRQSPCQRRPVAQAAQADA